MDKLKDKKLNEKSKDGLNIDETAFSFSVLDDEMEETVPKVKYFAETDHINDRDVKAIKKSDLKTPSPSENLKAIKRAMDNHSYLFGQVAAVEELNFSVNGESVLIYTVMVKGYECLILEEDFVMKVNNSFKRDGDTDINRYNKNKLTKARQLVKAIVPVIIKDIQEIEMGTDAVSGSKIYRYLIGGSRVEGMNSLQDKYFFHKHHRRNAETVNQGDITKARVIGVSDNHLWVEAFGVETYIPSIETDIKFVDNCKKYFHVGQEIKVKVKTINVNDGKVYLSLSKRLYDLELSPFRDSLQRMKEGGAYLGVVEKMKKDIYVVRLYNNVIAVVPFEHVKADIALRIGQTVNVICFRIRKDGYIIGAAFAG